MGNSITSIGDGKCIYQIGSSYGLSGFYFWNDKIVVCARHCRNIRLQPVTNFDREKGYGTGNCPFCEGGQLHGQYYKYRSQKSLSIILDSLKPMKTLTEFLKDNQITMQMPTLLEHGRSDGLMNDMPEGSKHYKIIFWRFHTRSMQVYFSCGPGIKTSPTAEDVFSCLISDAQAGELSFTDFMDEFGDRDWQRPIHVACVKMRKEMLSFLGAELLKEAAYEVEPY